MENLIKIIRQILTEEETDEFKNVPIGKLITFSDIENWSAKGIRWNLIFIYSDIQGHIMGELEYNEYDKKTRIFYQQGVRGKWKHVEDWPSFSNVKNAVRYIYLQSRKQNIVDEIVTNGEGDFANYFNENPAALNNDYIDHFLDSKDYYISDKVADRIPSPWNLGP